MDTELRLGAHDSPKEKVQISSVMLRLGIVSGAHSAQSWSIHHGQVDEAFLVSLSICRRQ